MIIPEGTFTSPDATDSDERYPSLTYAIANGHIIGDADGLNAVISSIDRIINTERWSYPIYDNSYGVELEHLIGQNISYATTNIPTLLSEALLSDDRVTSVSVTDITVNSDSITVVATVQTIYGDIKRSINV